MVIEKITSNFGKAIRDNTGKSVNEMSNGILASYYHASSTGKQPRHDKCPSGTNSYRFYNKALANKETTQSHTQMKVKFQLDKSARKHVLGIYIDLIKNYLLLRCMKGMILNPNESFHA